jgi:hypothetical protein
MDFSDAFLDVRRMDPRVREDDSFSLSTSETKIPAPGGDFHWWAVLGSNQ